MSTLLEDVEAFIGTHELSDSQFGVSAMNDKNFVRDLRNGRRIWPETEAKVRRFMATYRPAKKADAA